MRKSKTAGHLIRNDKIKKAGVYFTNTCRFDYFIACLCTLYRDLLTNEWNEYEINHNTGKANESIVQNFMHVDKSV